MKSNLHNALLGAIATLALPTLANAFQKISDTQVERIAPLTLEQVQAAIEVQSGYEVELVASEPLIKSPVAMAFDASGALWVVEMVDYSEQENDSLGRLSRLVDNDNDGVMDQAQVIAEGLSWPTALATLSQSTWVAAAPRILEFRSNPGSSQSTWDSSTLLDGLGRQNVQGLANSFRWGLDGRLHLSTSSNGGQLTTKPQGPLMLPANPTNVSGRDISFDLTTGKVNSVAGYGQHGMDFSPWGDRFVTSNSDHLQQVVAWYLPELTDAGLSKPVAWRRSIAEDGPQAEVFRISPVESWRTIRTQMRLAGISTGILEGQGRASGYFTSATGVTIYDGDQWPSTDEPVALIADVGSNLVHRKRLIRSGVSSKGRRIDSKTEFLRSKDTWFRPVQFANGPDGCLYIVDMARETIEHPKSIPEPIKSQVDLTSGRELGRIWRVKSTHRPIRREPVMLSKMNTGELCQTLAHPNGWHRETASQLLIERQDSNAIPQCRKILSASQSPLARLHAISVLASLPEGLDQSTWVASIQDPSVHVRLWAWVLSNRVQGLSAKTLQAESQKIQEWMKEETDLEVQMVMAVRSLQILETPDARAKLFAAWLNRKDPNVLGCDELRAAIEYAIRGKTARSLWEQSDWLSVLATPNQGTGFLDAMLYQLQQQGELVSIVRDWQTQKWTTDQAMAATEALGRLIDRKIVTEGSEAYEQLSKFATAELLPRLNAALKSGLSERQAESELGPTDSQRINAIRLLGTLPLPQRQDIFSRIVSDCPSPAIQCAVIEAWAPAQTALQKLALAKLDSANPLVTQSIFKALIRNESGATLLLDRLEQNGTPHSETPAWVWQALRAFPSETTKVRAQRLSPVSETPWESVASKYRDAWNKPGNPEQGATHFRKLCASCHRVLDTGVAIGPSLDSYRVRPNEAIALAVAEPSREMDPKYEQLQIRTKDGEVSAGILASSSQEQIVLITAQNQIITIARNDIEEWKSSGKSLMPDGMLKELDPQSLNDLIAFLRQVP